MTIALLCGAGFGLGILLIIRGLTPVRVSLAVALDRLHGTGAESFRRDAGSSQIPRQSPRDEVATVGLAERAGTPLARHLVAMPLLTARVRSDLVVLNRSSERHLAEKVTLGLTGFLLVPALAGLVSLTGSTLGWELPLWASLILGVGGLLVPDFGVRAEASKRRADFRHALGSFLDLVVISLAGGSGVEGALNEASAVGRGWSFDRLRQALEEALLMRTAPWGPLGRLGQELGVEELSELAASVSLAGSEGAKVRASLAAKARTIRTHALAEAQASAEAMSERMSLPVVLLFAGFLVFVGYPALAHVLEGL